MIATPAYYSNKTGYVDKKSGLGQAAFVARVDQIVQGLHADGTLKRLSIRSSARTTRRRRAQFDLSTIGQTVQ